MNLCNRRQPRGLTLVEVLVAIGIIGLLIALLVPAVQAAREAARRSRCASHLSQLIKAVHAFETAHGGFPPASYSLSGGPPPPFALYSTHVALLPYADQAATYDQINVAVDFNTEAHLGEVNATIAATTLDLFLCPSEPNTADSRWAPTSYRVSLGVQPMQRDPAGTYSSVEDGAFAYIKLLRVASFRDGLSNTLALSEKPLGSAEPGSYSPFRDWLLTGGAASADEWLAECSGLRRAERPQHAGGHTWMLPGAARTAFFAVVPPNGPVPDCGAMTDGGTGLFSARSYHPGGVNAAVADGSVRWFPTSTNAAVWRSLGTRSGGEVAE